MNFGRSKFLAIFTLWMLAMGIGNAAEEQPQEEKIVFTPSNNLTIPKTKFYKPKDLTVEEISDSYKKAFDRASASPKELRVRDVMSERNLLNQGALKVEFGRYMIHSSVPLWVKMDESDSMVVVAWNPVKKLVNLISRGVGDGAVYEL